MTVSFFTKCWGGDYHKLLAGGLEKKYNGLAYPFDCIGIAMNNGVDRDMAERFFNRANLIINVDKIAPEVLEFFSLTEESLGQGYNYSIAELACIFCCTTDYLCYIQSDCVSDCGDWVTEGIEILEGNPEISVVSPLSEVNTWHNTEGLDHFFSDQCWLVRTAEFKGLSYNDTLPELPEYPSHGGDSFERRVGRYLHNSGKYRKILQNRWYHHPAW